MDFDCVICDNDEMALGVIEALEAAGRDPGAAPIVSVDHTAEGAAALEERQALYDGGPESGGPGPGGGGGSRQSGPGSGL